MISREHIEKYRATGMWDEPINWPEFLDTLDAALKVVEAAKRMNGCCIAPCGIHRPKLREALAPFTAPRGNE